MVAHHQQRRREGFPNQRLVILPARAIRRCDQIAPVAGLYATHLGAFPSAPHHFVARESGCPQAILIFCMNGAGSLEMDNQTHAIGPGDLAVIPPFVPHVYRADERDPWSIFWLHLAGTHLRDALGLMGTSRARPLLHVPDRALMRGAFEDLYATLSYRYADGGLVAMAGEVLRLLSRIQLHQSASPTPRHPASDRILQTVAFMERHVELRLTITALAARAGLPVSTFGHQFRQRTGRPPMAYFIQLKVGRACDLLQQTALTVREIAGQLGYDDPYYFSRIFKRVQGCSPVHYRAALAQLPA